MGPMSQRNVSLGWIGYLVLFGIFAVIYWADAIDKAWYAATYTVFPDHVYMDSKPPDCDFMQAPLGRKGCHYEAEVSASNAQGIWIGGDAAPKFRLLNSGQIILSRDDGKTWDTWHSWAGASTPDLTITEVHVSWSRITD